MLLDLRFLLDLLLLDLRFLLLRLESASSSSLPVWHEGVPGAADAAMFPDLCELSKRLPGLSQTSGQLAGWSPVRGHKAPKINSLIFGYQRVPIAAKYVTSAAHT